MPGSTGGRGERTVRVREVRPVQSRSGNTRFVLTDDDGERYSTFREEIGERAMTYVGKPARISFHRTRRGEFENVYLDAIDEPDEARGSTEADTSSEAAPPSAAPSIESARPCPDDVEEVAWRTAVEAAPWLLGGDPKTGVAPEQLFEKLKPLKDLVAEDLVKSRSAAASSAEEGPERRRGGAEHEPAKDERGVEEEGEDAEEPRAPRGRPRRGAAPSQR